MADPLKEQVLAASLALIASGGVAALSMREVARRAKVSHQAPYHHFPDKESIVAALVERGYDRLSARLTTAVTEAEGGSREALLTRAARAYVDFALEDSAYFRVMFRPDLIDEARFPAVQAAGDRSFALLQAVVDTHVAPGAPKARRAALVSLIWAEVHGLATLLVDGKLAYLLPDDRERDRHVKQVIALFVERLLAA